MVVGVCTFLKYKYSRSYTFGNDYSESLLKIALIAILVGIILLSHFVSIKQHLLYNIYSTSDIGSSVTFGGIYSMSSFFSRPFNSNIAKRFK
jgi:hypothetical protein